MLLDVIALAVVGGARSLTGFVENLLVDKKTTFESIDLGKMAGTSLKFVVLGTALHLGFGLDIVSTAGITVASDFGIMAIKKKFTKK